MRAKARIDFIGIGYAKSGTSYVYKQLNSHPEIDLPIIKEIRYLNESWFMPKGNWRNKILSNHWHYVKYRKLLFSRIKYWAKHPRNIKNDHWYRRYLLGKRSDSWYDKLFSEERFSGEFTPAYVYMSEKQIADLSIRFPELKIIIMLRNPIDRTWSHVKMNLAKHQGRTVSELSQEEIQSRMKEVLALNPKYSESIPLWKKYFDHVFIGFHDDIIERPSGLIKDLLEFIGVSDLSLDGLDVKKKVNVGFKGDIPAREFDLLHDYFKEEIELLKRTTNWPYLETWALKDPKER